MTESIKPYLPFTLVYFEIFDSREAAIKRERYFKTSASAAF
jgi:putative endonuclease